jgi:hypothetical protein
MSNSSTGPWGDPAFEQAVRDTAYFLWEQDGRPQGREQEYWFAALERRLRQREYDKELAGPGSNVGERQLDDNIDDLGRSATDPGRPPLDQPVGEGKTRG